MNDKEMTLAFLSHFQAVGVGHKEMYDLDASGTTGTK